MSLPESTVSSSQMQLFEHSNEKCNNIHHITHSQPSPCSTNPSTITYVVIFSIYFEVCLRIIILFRNTFSCWLRYTNVSSIGQKHLNWDDGYGQGQNFGASTQIPVSGHKYLLHCVLSIRFS